MIFQSYLSSQFQTNRVDKYLVQITQKLRFMQMLIKKRINHRKTGKIKKIRMTNGNLNKMTKIMMDNNK